MNNMKIVAVGSGQDGLNMPETIQEIISLSGKLTPNVLYLGTASYDSCSKRVAQVGLLEKAGCRISSLDIAQARIPFEDMEKMFDSTDVLVVSGGNTLYAVSRWKLLGVDKLIRKAGKRGVVMSGGSAGAICWFDGGHSDSMDPTSYRVPAPSSDNWEYIRVNGLGIIPGLCCPHHDKTQSNGIPRAEDFNRMLLVHKGEVGIAISHWAALVICNTKYKVVRLKESEGCGVFRKTVINGIVECTEIPREGLVSDILQKASSIIQDPRIEEAMSANPCDFERV